MKPLSTPSDEGHFWNAACMLNGCEQCRAKWLAEDTDTLPTAAQPAEREER